MTKKVLIIDDDPDARLYYTTILEDMDMQFLEAVDGEEGVIKVKQERPDLILLDLMMPKKGGLRVFNELKEDPILQHIPIIMISGATSVTGVDMKKYVYERPHHERRVEVTGKRIQTTPVEFLEKPIDPDHLIEVAKKVLNI